MSKFDDPSWDKARLESENPIVPLGDIWTEHNTPGGKAKRGTGAKRWNDLPYWNPGGGASAIEFRNSVAYTLRAGGSDHWDVDVNSLVGWYDPTTGSLFLGQSLIHNQSSGDGGRMMADFMWDGPGLRLRTRNITLAMIADPVDLNMQRYGPGSGGFPYGPGPPYSFDNLTGLGAGSLVSQVRSTPALVPNGGDANTAGGRAESTNVVLSMECTDMPRKATTDGQTSNGGRFQINICPRDSHDFRQTYFSIDSQGFTRIGNKAVSEGNTSALINLRVHEGENSQQSIAITGTPTGGTYKIRFYSIPASDTTFCVEVDTATIAYNASATGAGSVQEKLVAAINTLSGNVPDYSPATAWSAITTADVTVTGSFPTYTVEFTGVLAGTPMFRMQMVEKAFTGGSSPGGSISRVNQQGIATQAALHVLRISGCTGGTGDYLRVISGAGVLQANITSAGKLFVVGEVEIDGALNHDGTTVGFYGVPPVTRPTTYTQTFSTADKTHAARTAEAITDNTGGTADTTTPTLAVIPDPADAPASADALRDDLVANTIPAIKNAIATLADQVNKGRADHLDSASFLNSLVDDMQALGLAQ